MVTAGPYESHRNREVTGFLLSFAFAGLAAVRDVYFGGLFQEVNPLLVALTAFGLCSLVFLPIALVRDRAGLTALVRRRSQLFWINATTGVAWLSFFFALRTIEPALVQVLFYGIGPLSVRWVDGLVPGSTRATLTRVERALHLGRLSPSTSTLTACVLYAVFAVAAAIGRRRAIADRERLVPPNLDLPRQAQTTNVR